MALKSIIFLAMSVTLVLGQRPSFAGSRPIGYPEIITSTTEGLGDRFGEDQGTTQRLPIEANGDRDLIDRLSKLPVDKQPFWFINWQAYESHRQKPQSFPQSPNNFIDTVLPSNTGDGLGNRFGTTNPVAPQNNSDGLENRFNPSPTSSQVPNNSNSNPQLNYPSSSNQPINYPNGPLNPNQNYPNNPVPNYPNQFNYPNNPVPNYPNQFNYPNNPVPNYPNQFNYPNNQVPNYPNNQFNYPNGQVPNYPNNQFNYPNGQLNYPNGQFNYPYANYPNGQLNYPNQFQYPNAQYNYPGQYYPYVQPGNYPINSQPNFNGQPVSTQVYPSNGVSHSPVPSNLPSNSHPTTVDSHQHRKSSKATTPVSTTKHR